MFSFENWDTRILAEMNFTTIMHFLVVSAVIVMFFASLMVMISIAVANVKDVMSQAEDFKLARKVLNINRIEKKLTFFPNKIWGLKNMCCCAKFKKWLLLLQEEDKCVFRIFPYKNMMNKRGRSSLMLPHKFGNPNAIARINYPVYIVTLGGSEDQKPIHSTLPGWIWENSKSVLEEQFLGNGK